MFYIIRYQSLVFVSLDDPQNLITIYILPADNSSI